MVGLGVARLALRRASARGHRQSAGTVLSMQIARAVRGRTGGRDLPQVCFNMAGTALICAGAHEIILRPPRPRLDFGTASPSDQLWSQDSGVLLPRSYLQCHCYPRRSHATRAHRRREGATATEPSTGSQTCQTQIPHRGGWPFRLRSGSCLYLRSDAAARSACRSGSFKNAKDETPPTLHSSDSDERGPRSGHAFRHSRLEISPGQGLEERNPSLPARGGGRTEIPRQELAWGRGARWE
ncbi:hypothetical protein GGR56DRAFT_461158 [Xylariaceae sp. FL0804]|nr:hypothetical protein GGR56DRAFT_461158 [Xylariaceae sp. FL0804]